MKQHLECLGVDDECIKNLRVKIKGQTYKHPLLWVFADQEKVVDEAFYRQLEGAYKL